MSKFKIGDMVMPVKADRRRKDMKRLLGKTLRVIDVGPYGENEVVVTTAEPGDINRVWLGSQLELVSSEFNPVNHLG